MKALSDGGTAGSGQRGSVRGSFGSWCSVFFPLSHCSLDGQGPLYWPDVLRPVTFILVGPALAFVWFLYSFFPLPTAAASTDTRALVMPQVALGPF